MILTGPLFPHSHSSDAAGRRWGRRDGSADEEPVWFFLQNVWRHGLQTHRYAALPVYCSPFVIDKYKALYFCLRCPLVAVVFGSCDVFMRIFNVEMTPVASPLLVCSGLYTSYLLVRDFSFSFITRSLFLFIFLLNFYLFFFSSHRGRKEEHLRPVHWHERLLPSCHWGTNELLLQCYLLDFICCIYFIFSYCVLFSMLSVPFWHSFTLFLHAFKVKPVLCSTFFSFFTASFTSL